MIQARTQILSSRFFFERKVQTQRSRCVKDARPGSARVVQETYLRLVVVKHLQRFDNELDTVS